jgi:uncharacterized protein YbbC (DUF1343 family)
MNIVKLQLFFLSLAFFSWFSLTGQIITGAEQTEHYFPLLQEKKVAVCFNPTSVIGATHLVDTLVSANVNVVKIFAPEHGFRGEAEAGATIHSTMDVKTEIPIVSLYGKNKKPTQEQLQNVDIIVFDIQDVGCRFFTYISTLHFVMEAAAEAEIPLLILDRPNPNGYFVDGPVLEEKYKSFVGIHPVPVVHGMTIGEYAQMINGEKWLENNLVCELLVIECKNYTHSNRYPLPIKPSPNLSSDEAIYLYPSLCLFEGTDISLGRGTTTPFQIFGHPNLTTGNFYFTPKPIKGVSENPPQNGNQCRGYDLTSVAKANLNNHNSFNISYLIDAYNHFPKEMKFFANPDFFDKLAGNSTLRWQIINGKTEEEIRASWQPALNIFKKIRSKYIFYPE